MLLDKGAFKQSLSTLNGLLIFLTKFLLILFATSGGTLWASGITAFPAKWSMPYTDRLTGSLHKELRFDPYPGSPSGFPDEKIYSLWQKLFIQESNHLDLLGHAITKNRQEPDLNVAT